MRRNLLQRNRRELSVELARGGILATLVMLGLMAATVAAQGPSGRGASRDAADATHMHVLIVPIDEIDLPAQEAGVIVELKARMGTEVKKGQLIGRVNDKDAQARLKAARAELEMARVQAETDAPVQEALAMVEIAEAEYQNSQQINREQPGAVSLFELRRLEATAKRAHFRAEIARVDQQVARLTVHGREAQVERIQAELERRQLVSPISGVVVQRFRDVGEWVNAGDPVVRILRMDRLRAEAMVDANKYTPAELLGKRIELVVVIKSPESSEAVGSAGGDAAPGEVVERVVAEITHVSPEVDAGGYFYAHAEFDNIQRNGQWVIRPGLKARVVPHSEAAKR